MKHSHTVSAQSKQDHPKSWRDVLPVHPAADLFPLMSADELRELADDIDKHGQQEPIDLYHDKTGNVFLIDGRNRLDALALLGRGIDDVAIAKRHCDGDDCDPVAYVISKNIHRRHLTSEQKRDLIAKLLKAHPEKSDRQIAKTVGRSKNTVAKERKKLESTGQIDQLKKRTGADGKERKAKHDKKRATGKVTGSLNGSRPTPDMPKKSDSENALAEFKYAVATWLPKMDRAHRKEAVTYIADLFEDDEFSILPIDRVEHRKRKAP